MRPFQLLLAVAAPALLVSAAPPARAAEPEAPFVSTGEIVYRTSAAYDATRVRGPNVNMAVTKDGSWGGNLLAKDVMLKIAPDRITGAGVNLVVKQDATSISVEGMISGIRVRVKATATTFVGRVGDRQAECGREPSGYCYMAGGRTSSMHFKGTANRWPDVPMPQWIFAVIGAI
jgi:hypothetical protein